MAGVPSFQPMNFGRDDVTEDLIALANEKREVHDTAHNNFFVQATKELLSNPNLDSVASARVIVQQIHDPEQRAKMEKQVEILEEQKAKESDSRFANLAGALLGPLCQSEVRGVPCTRVADPRYGVMCKQCYHNLTRLPRAMGAEERFQVKQEKKRSREQSAREKKATLVARIQAEQNALIKQYAARKKTRSSSPLALSAATASSAPPLLSAPIRAQTILSLPAPSASATMPDPIYQTFPISTSVSTPSVLQLGICEECLEEVTDLMLSPCRVCSASVCDLCMDRHVRSTHAIACTGCNQIIIASKDDCCNKCSAYACEQCQPSHTCSMSWIAPSSGEEEDQDSFMDEEE